MLRWVKISNPATASPNTAAVHRAGTGWPADYRSAPFCKMSSADLKINRSTGDFLWIYAVGGDDFLFNQPDFSCVSYLSYHLDSFSCLNPALQAGKANRIIIVTIITTCENHLVTPFGHQFAEGQGPQGPSAGIGMTATTSRNACGPTPKRSLAVNPLWKHGKDPKVMTLDPLHKWGWINNDQHLPSGKLT